MKRFLIDISLLLILLFSAHLLSVTTGLLAGEVNISIQQVTDGEITMFVYEPVLLPGQNQTILVEFTNTGTTNYTAMIEENIYFYDNNKLNLTKEFFDTAVPLHPGMRRSFTTYYMPPNIGTYYIQIKAHYSTRIERVWGAFAVVTETHYEEPSPGGPAQVPVIVQGVPAMSLEYPDTVKVFQNQSRIINITVNNIGEADLFHLRLYVSATEDIEIDVSPKEIYSLSVNYSTMFLVMVYIPEDLPLGQYLLNLEVVSDKRRESGELTLDVLPVMTIEDIYDRLLNYEYLILLIETDIISASLRGFDVTLAEQSLDSAKRNLQDARDHYNLEEYDLAIKELGDTERDIMEAVFQLHHAMFVLYGISIQLSLFIVILLAIIIIILLYIYLRRKRKEKRPKLLREVSET